MSIGDELPPMPRPGGVPKGGGMKRDLRDVAVSQKGILVCILLQILLVVANFMVPQNSRIFIAVTSLAIGVVQAVFVFRLAIRLYSVGLGVLCGILALIPCIGLLTLLVMNSKATTILRASGHKVGLLGVDLAEFPA